MSSRWNHQQTIQEAEMEDLQQEIIRLKRQMSRLEQRKGLSPLARDFVGTRPQDYQIPSFCNDLFEGSNHKSFSAPLIESSFDWFEDSLLKSSSLPVYDEPLYDEYDDDTFIGVLDFDQPIYDDYENKVDAPPELVIPDKTTTMLTVIDSEMGMTKLDHDNYLDIFALSDTKFMKALAVIANICMIDRIARVAFEVARKRQSKLCSVDKANVLEASMLWRKRVNEIASEYSDVQLSHMYVDNAAMQLIRDPRQFDTIVTNNIFGDILSDEASIITGSIGMLPSASISESGPGLFEPIHGSAPDIAGQDKANPLATVLSAAMLLRYGLGEENAARRIEAAVIETLNKGFRTSDIHSSGMVLVGCKRMGEEVLKSVNSQKLITAIS
ncbi:hypothetical protein M5K25_012273 [Dendrobium thyrsiflorum]|uniref:3-isopropylmalate dehydrogenase n=1 Tax=Dendrobium thyrsiflorum TaxID=117978 RepID=A0ABD0UWJ8_DENTH